MKYQLTAPSRFDRFLCRVLHPHQRWKAAGYVFRNCLTPGCGMLCRRATLWTVITVRSRRRAIASECEEARRA